MRCSAPSPVPLTSTFISLIRFPLIPSPVTPSPILECASRWVGATTRSTHCFMLSLPSLSPFIPTTSSLAQSTSTTLPLFFSPSLYASR